MSIERAIAKLEDQIAAYGQGTKTQPQEGSADWHVLRALALGLSHLRAVQATGNITPVEAEQMYKAALAAGKAAVK